MDQLANGVFHGVLFRPQAVARDAQVEKLGIIRGEGRLANRSDQMADLRASSRVSPLPHLSVFTFQNAGPGVPVMAI
ncbi:MULTISPECIES: hypothetical protein [unclassified Pseudomonas]|uniref:hypothetical protein n=1 Tax=unclassified Pseudomonas TaxID=196821 RepID=UPI0023E43D95|nr:hypothetical protein [Pseudomonas sp. D3]WET11081.1 hypothetical protein P3S72_02805 [Pseudomonas sp. D3]